MDEIKMKPNKFKVINWEIYVCKEVNKFCV